MRKSICRGLICLRLRERDRRRVRELRVDDDEAVGRDEHADGAAAAGEDADVAAQRIEVRFPSAEARRRGVSGRTRCEKVPSATEEVAKNVAATQLHHGSSDGHIL